jgi:hypothetical protein
MLLVSCGLLITIAPHSSAGLNYNASKSNTGNIVVHPEGVFTADQVLRITKMVDQASPGKLDEAAVRGFLKQAAGSKEASIKAIVVERNPGGKGSSILLLADPKDVDTARGMVTGKRKY